MEHLGSILSAVLTVTTIIGVAAAGLQRAVVQNLRDANKDLRDRDGDREKDLKDAQTEAATLKSDLEALGRMVRNDAVVLALGDQITELAQQQAAASQMQTQIGRDILDAIKRLSGGTDGTTP